MPTSHHYLGTSRAHAGLRVYLIPRYTWVLFPSCHCLHGASAEMVTDMGGVEVADILQPVSISQEIFLPTSGQDEWFSWKLLIDVTWRNSLGKILTANDSNGSIYYIRSCWLRKLQGSEKCHKYEVNQVWTHRVGWRLWQVIGHKSHPVGPGCLLYCLTGMQTQLPVILGFQEPGNAEVHRKLFH